MTDVTRILSAIEFGDPHAAEQLLPQVYGELRKLAAMKLAQERPGQTLQATALANEAYLRLVGGESDAHWDRRGHFIAAAEATRRLLVESARRRKALQRGDGRRRLGLAALHPAAPGPREGLPALDEALSKLAASDRTAADRVRLRYFTVKGDDPR
jgi:RNA polymerase sigma factor (TIGR02999 family)